MTRDASRPRRILPALATSSLAALALTGCSWMSPVQTDITNPPADGVEVDLGSVKVTNLLVVADNKDAEGVVVGSVANRGTSEARLAVGEKEYTVPAGGLLNLQQAGASVRAAGAAPGAMTTIKIAASGAGSKDALVPVLAAEGPYASVTPSAVSASAATEATTKATAPAADASTTPAPSTTDASPSPTH